MSGNFDWDRYDEIMADPSAVSDEELEAFAEETYESEMDRHDTEGTPDADNCDGW